jgi:hypothetical protein
LQASGTAAASQIVSSTSLLLSKPGGSLAGSFVHYIGCWIISLATVIGSTVYLSWQRDVTLMLHCTSEKSYAVAEPSNCNCIATRSGWSRRMTERSHYSGKVLVQFRVWKVSQRSRSSNPLVFRGGRDSGAVNGIEIA